MRLTLSHIYVVPSFFKEKEGTEEKPFGRKTAFFEKGLVVGMGLGYRVPAFIEPAPS